MYLLADSGSTRSTWLMTDGDDTRRVTAHGINAVLHTSEQIRTVLDSLPDCGSVDEIAFYGAGCGATFPEASEKLRRELLTRFGCGRITVESDLTGAARALFGRGEGIACILGTGSNSGWCRDGQIVRSVPPLGYILGDEGSGSALGRALLNGIFKGDIPLREAYLETFATSYEETLHRVYGAPYANRFLASLAPFVAAHTDLPQIRAMVLRCFGEFAARNISRYPADLPIAFVGGVAAHFEPLLREAMATAGREMTAVVESPAEGLLKYHYGK